MILNKDKKYFLVFWGDYTFQERGGPASMEMQEKRFQKRAEAEEFFDHHVEKQFHNAQDHAFRCLVMLAVENNRITECRSHMISRRDLENLSERFFEKNKGTLEESMWEEFHTALGGWGDGRYVEVNNLYLDYPIPR